MKYSITSTYTMSVRGNHNVYANKTHSMNAGKKAEGNEIWIATADSRNVKAGDKWLRIESLDGNSVKGWVAIIHMGKLYCELKEVEFIPNPVPDGEFPKYAKVMHYIERFGKSILEYSYPNPKTRPHGIPECFQLYQTSDQKPVLMTKKVQEWMFGLFEESALGTGLSRADIIKCWTSTFMGGRAFTNKAGFPAYANYIAEPNSKSGAPKLAPVICSGATVKVLSVGTKAHIQMAEIEVADVFDDKTFDLTLANNTHLIYAAMNWNDMPPPHGSGIPFPKLNDRDVPIPLLGNNTTSGYIDAAWLKFLDEGVKKPVYPYYPVR